ncbi:class I SAM-dependent methyltransferase [uncultured Devosia sp.]|uniref:class I SAM-dependent methyltransferase n=1 Tax=uncultured Devosia sp. TaxID=211434 RepID=UPI002613F3C2|nr:class I SAM-dependent methyltransferase [uncultured Devosia sp.]
MTAEPDFERYADQKTFNTSIPPTWRAAYDRLVADRGWKAADIRFLDVGCGDGKFFEYLKSKGLALDHIDGVEVSHKRVERCHAIGWTSVRYMAPGSALPYPDQSFDVINLMEVVEHVPAGTIDSLLAEVTRVLAPTGVVLISTPNYPIKRFYDFFNAFVHGKWKRLRDDPTHITLYNHNRLRSRLGKHFGTLEELSFKDGFLYKRWPRPFFRHKLFFACSDVRS